MREADEMMLNFVEWCRIVSNIGIEVAGKIQKWLYHATLYSMKFADVNMGGVDKGYCSIFKYGPDEGFVKIEHE